MTLSDFSFSHFSPEQRIQKYTSLIEDYKDRYASNGQYGMKSLPSTPARSGCSTPARLKCSTATFVVILFRNDSTALTFENLSQREFPIDAQIRHIPLEIRAIMF